MTVGTWTEWCGKKGTQGSTDGVGTASLFDTPSELCTDGDTIWVADYGNKAVRAIDVATATVSTILADTDFELDDLGVDMKPHAIGHYDGTLFIITSSAHAGANPTTHGYTYDLGTETLTTCLSNATWSGQLNHVDMNSYGTIMGVVKGDLYLPDISSVDSYEFWASDISDGLGVLHYHQGRHWWVDNFDADIGSCIESTLVTDGPNDYDPPRNNWSSRDSWVRSDTGDAAYEKMWVDLADGSTIIGTNLNATAESDQDEDIGGKFAVALFTVDGDGGYAQGEYLVGWKDDILYPFAVGPGHSSKKGGAVRVKDVVYFCSEGDHALYAFHPRGHVRMSLRYGPYLSS